MNCLKRWFLELSWRVNAWVILIPKDCLLTPWFAVRLVHMDSVLEIWCTFGHLQYTWHMDMGQNDWSQKRWIVRDPKQRPVLGAVVFPYELTNIWMMIDHWKNHRSILFEHQNGMIPLTPIWSRCIHFLSSYIHIYIYIYAELCNITSIYAFTLQFIWLILTARHILKISCYCRCDSK